MDYKKYFLQPSPESTGHICKATQVQNQQAIYVKQVLIIVKVKLLHKNPHFSLNQRVLSCRGVLEYKSIFSHHNYRFCLGTGTNTWLSFFSCTCYCSTISLFLSFAGHQDVINFVLVPCIQVIAKLTDGKSTHIPYRDSKLTRLLQSSLSGHGRVSVSLVFFFF